MLENLPTWPISTVQCHYKTELQRYLRKNTPVLKIYYFNFLYLEKQIRIFFHDIKNYICYAIYIQHEGGKYLYIITLIIERQIRLPVNGSNMFTFWYPLNQTSVKYL